ncbi:MAG: hypothetical protein ACXADC_17170 [Candidatus Thorarchaeota archaeon]
MAFSAIASPDKSENLTYAILPTSIGVFIAIATQVDAIVGLGVVTLVASFGVLFLFELRPIERRLERRYCDRVLNEDYGKSHLTWTVLRWNMLFRMWEAVTSEQSSLLGTMTGSRPIKMFEDLVESEADSVVKGYTFRRRLRQMRVSLYLMMSVPLMVWTALVYAVRAYSFFQVPPGILFIYVGAAVLPILLDFVLWRANRSRYKDIQKDLFKMIQFYALQKYSAAFYVAHMYRKRDSSQFDSIRAEIESLNQILEQNDWSRFRDRWYHIGRRLETRAFEVFMRDLMPILMGEWARLYRSEILEERAQTSIATMAIFLWTCLALIENRGSNVFELEAGKLPAALMEIAFEHLPADNFSRAMTTEIPKIIVQIIWDERAGLDSEIIRNTARMVLEIAKPNFGWTSETESENSDGLTRRLISEIIRSRLNPSITLPMVVFVVEYVRYAIKNSLTTELWNNTNPKELVVFCSNIPKNIESKEVVYSYISESHVERIVEVLQIPSFADILSKNSARTHLESIWNKNMNPNEEKMLRDAFKKLEWQIPKTGKTKIK